VPAPDTPTAPAALPVTLALAPPVASVPASPGLTPAASVPGPPLPPHAGGVASPAALPAPLPPVEWPRPPRQGGHGSRACQREGAGDDARFGDNLQLGRPLRQGGHGRGRPLLDWTCFACVGVDADLAQWPRRKHQEAVPQGQQDWCRVCLRRPAVLLARAPSRLRGGDPEARGGRASPPGATALGAASPGAMLVAVCPDPTAGAPVSLPGATAATPGRGAPVGAPPSPGPGPMGASAATGQAALPPTDPAPPVTPTLGGLEAAALPPSVAPTLREGRAPRCVVCGLERRWDGSTGPLRSCSGCRDAWCSRGCFLDDATHRRECGAFPPAAAAAATSRAGPPAAALLAAWLGDAGL